MVRLPPGPSLLPAHPPTPETPNPSSHTTLPFLSSRLGQPAAASNTACNLRLLGPSCETLPQLSAVVSKPRLHAGHLCLKLSLGSRPGATQSARQLRSGLRPKIIRSIFYYSPGASGFHQRQDPPEHSLQDRWVQDIFHPKSTASGTCDLNLVPLACGYAGALDLITGGLFFIFVTQALGRAASS